MEKVKEILKDLETKHSIRIIYAVEAGSRAWGMESADSDYDIRFVFVHSDPRKYASLRTPKETIDGFSPDRVYDWQGWDVRKALVLMKQMNPSIIEWVYSSIVYIDDNDEFEFGQRARQIVEHELLVNKRLAPLLYHYKSMAKSNFNKHIDKKTTVQVKKYLYVIRPAGMFLWLTKLIPKLAEDNKPTSESSTKPLFCIDFKKVLDELHDNLGDELYKIIVELIRVKKEMNESDDKLRNDLVDKWIDSVLNNSGNLLKQVSQYKYEPDSNHDESNDPYDSLLFDLIKLKL